MVHRGQFARGGGERAEAEEPELLFPPRKRGGPENKAIQLFATSITAPHLKARIVSDLQTSALDLKQCSSRFSFTVSRRGGALGVRNSIVSGARQTKPKAFNSAELTF